MTADRNLSLDISTSALFATLTAVGAYISIPFFPVPITLQSFFVYLSGGVLGARRGALSQLIYLGLGLGGLPVFAGARSGLPWLTGPTVGYAFAFPVASYLIGSFTQKGSGGRPLIVALVTAAATGAIYLAGAGYLVAWLDFNTGMDLLAAAGRGLWSGMVIFLPGDAVKIAAATVLISLLRGNPAIRSVLGYPVKTGA